MRNIEEETKLANIENAETMQKAFSNFIEHPERIENFISYLENHFSAWVQKYANNPNGIANEFLTFSEIE